MASATNIVSLAEDGLLDIGQFDHQLVIYLQTTGCIDNDQVVHMLAGE